MHDRRLFDVGRCPPLFALALSVGLLVGPTAAPAHAAPPAPVSQQAPAETTPPTLGSLIDEALADPFVVDAAVGVHVVDLETGEVLYERGATQPLNPASNVKLVTTAAALGILGPDHRYTTQVFIPKDGRQGSAIQGDLYLQGSGDPDLVTGDLYELATRLRADGITRVGGVVVDPGAFDRDELPPGFDQKNEMASYRAPSGATTVNYNTFVIRARPGAAIGDPVAAEVLPRISYLDLTVEAKTSEGKRRKLWVEVEHKKDRVRLVVHGSTGVDAAAESFRYPVGDTSRYAGEVLVMALSDAGIKVARKTPKVGSVPKGAELIEAHRSRPLSILIRSVNKWSNNFMAEQILKTLDDHDPATFAGALDRVRGWVKGVGVPAQGLQLGNGSGLYDNNRVSPQQMTKLLTAVYKDFRIRADYLASMAIMGTDGTTRSRLSDGAAKGWVRVKTGTLDGVSALSGYAGALDRKPIVFAIMMNELPGSGTSKAREIQNRIAELLARQAAGKPLVDPAAAVVP